MRPAERLKIFEEELKDCGAHPPEYFRSRDILWLINRVKRLTEALEDIIKSDERTWKKYPQSKGVYSYYADIARKALEEE